MPNSIFMRILQFPVYSIISVLKHSATLKLCVKYIISQLNYQVIHCWC